MEASQATKIGYRTRGDKTLIEIRLMQSRQLFDNRDPSPFIYRDLDQDAVDYIVGAVSEIRSSSPFELVIHLTNEPAGALPEKDIKHAIHGFFKIQNQLMESKIALIFKRARIGLGLGLILLFTCLTISNLMKGVLTPGVARDVVGEGFVIMGWVAMWKPMEVLLYEWWPLFDMRRLYQRLGACDISIHTKEPHHEAAPS